jgi:hypothetical protein
VNTTPRTYALAKNDGIWKGVSLAESAESSENESSSGVNERNEIHPAKNDTQDAATHPKPAPSMPPTTMSDADMNSMKADAGHLVHKRDGSTSSDTSGSSRKASKSKIGGGSVSPAGSPHRSRFMDKIKGEVKVISGKLAHNEEKVEEGRRLMGKAT